MWLGRAEKRHARLLACPVSWQYDLGWHSMITGSWPAASVNRIWLIHILYFSTSHTYTLEYKSVLFSYSWDVTLGRGVISERTIAKPLTPEKTRTMNDENRRTYGHCSQIYVIRGLLSDYFWQIYFFFFFLSGTFHFRDAQSLSFKTRPNTRMKLKMMIFLYRADKTFKNILHRIRKMVSFELGKEIEKEFFRLITSVGRRKKSEFP